MRNRRIVGEMHASQNLHRGCNNLRGPEAVPPDTKSTVLSSLNAVVMS
jgi:hypothetical protein